MGVERPYRENVCSGGRTMNLFRAQFQRGAARHVAAKPARRFLTVWLAFIVMLLSANVVAWGQDNATITGTVSDATGAIVTNAAISITNPSTGQARKATSNSAGEYRFPNVGVGHYTLEASAPGFEKFTK